MARDLAEEGTNGWFVGPGNKDEAVAADDPDVGSVKHLADRDGGSDSQHQLVALGHRIHS